MQNNFSLKKINSFKVNSKEFSKFLKLFKLDSSLYLKVTPHEIIVKNIDFKNYLGVIECGYKVDSGLKEVVCFKVESGDILNKLDNFKDQVVFELHPIQQTLKLYDPNESSYDYIIRSEFSVKADKYCNLSIVENLSGIIEFNMESQLCLNYLKIMTVVENTLFFRIFKNNLEEPIQLISKKITSIGSKFLKKDDIQEYKFNSDDPVVEFEIYYPTVINLFLKEIKKIKFIMLENYLLLSSSDNQKEPHIYFKIYLPLREIN